MDKSILRKKAEELAKMISVVVPTYEEMNVERCLMLSNRASDTYEIIVVDGNGKDRTTEIAAKLR
jgi:glycosyltransferase involved in cell wall biosynthesis